MRNLLFLGTCLLFTAFLVQGTSAAVPTTDTEPDLEETTYLGSSLRIQIPPAQLSRTAQQDTLWLFGGPGTAEGKFQDANGTIPDPQGWEGVDLTDQPTYWHVDTFNAENLGGHGVGNHAMWCGTTEGLLTPPGYGNSWNDILMFTSDPLANPQVGQTVSLNMFFNYDSEPGYDFLFVEYDSSGVWITVDAFDGTNHDGTEFPAPGVQYASVATRSISYTGGDYGGDAADQIRIRLRFESDGGWSDEDQLWPTLAGAAQVDDITVTWSDGSSFENFEGAGPYAWIQEKAPFVGDFCKLFPRLTVIDECRQNLTPQTTFIDDGSEINNAASAPPGYPTSTGGTTSLNWSYGVSGGWVLNYNGGVSFGTLSLLNGIISPPIPYDLPGPEDDGPEWAGLYFRFDTWNHLDFGIFFSSWFRFSTDGGATWSVWERVGSNYYGGPYYSEFPYDATQAMVQGTTHVQYRFMARELIDVFDATPSPTLDNVAIMKYRIPGPTITRDRLWSASNDGFPQSGLIDVSTQAARDALDISFDTSADLSPASGVIICGDSLTVDITAVIAGTTVADTRMIWVLDRNPLFDDVRVVPSRPQDTVDTTTYPGKWVGEVLGQESTTSTGAVIADRYFFDLPDEDFFYPGDRLRYYYQATDSDGRITTLPDDITGFLDGDGYDVTWSIKGLPSIRDEQGTQPRILLVNNYGYRGGHPYFYQAFGQNGYVEYVDYDIYTVTRPSNSWTSAGIGSAGAHGANADQLRGYETIIFTAENLPRVFLSDGSDNGSTTNKADDIGALTQWHNQPADRHLAFFGEDIVSHPWYASAPAQTFIQTIMGVDLQDYNVRDEVEMQMRPVVEALLPQFSQVYIANGGCLGVNQFDSIRPIAPAVRGHGFRSLAGPVYASIAATVVNDRLIDGNRKAVVTLPYGFIHTDDTRSKVPGTRSARAALVQEILDYFGTYLPSGPAVGTDPTPAKPFYDFAQYPNPFNPSMTVEFKLGVASKTSVRIYNLRGERVAELFNGELGIGPHSFVWGGRDASGSTVASGVYLLEVKGQSFNQVKKVALVK